MRPVEILLDGLAWLLIVTVFGFFLYLL